VLVLLDRASNRPPFLTAVHRTGAMLVVGGVPIPVTNVVHTPRAPASDTPIPAASWT